MSLTHRMPFASRSPRRYGFPLVAAVLAVLALACGFASSAWASETGRIDGTVTSASGDAPIKGITVCADLRGGGIQSCASTEADGDYAIAGLAGGEYVVSFSPSSGSALNFVPQYYDDKSSFSEATPVAVAAGGTISGIDAELEVGGEIEGEVTEAAGGAPIEGIEVCASKVSGGEGFFGDCARTGVGGKYTVPGLASGEYKVEFSVPFESALNFLTQYYNDKSSYSEATPVSVTAGASAKSGIDAEMEPGGEISGKVTSASGGAGLEGVEVCAEEPGIEEDFGRCATTGAGGDYTISSLPSGSYVVAFFPGSSELNYVTQYYEDSDSYSGAKLVSVTAPDTKSGIDAQLAIGGQISGRVTDASTAAALQEIEVCAFPRSTTGEEARFEHCTSTAANGEYTISGLASGEYDVEFISFFLEPSTYLTQYYSDKYLLAEAQSVTVVQGSLVSGIDAAMERGPAAAPKNTGLPVVSGAPAVGHALSCSSGSWSGTPAPTFTYQWLLGGTPIPGATATTYQVLSADEGHSLACEVTAKNVVKSASALSVAVPIPVAPPPPPPPPKPVVTIVSSKLALSGHPKALRVKLQCGGATCDGSVELTVKVLTKRRKGRKTITHKRTLVLARGSFSLAAGKSATVTLHLTVAGRKLLAHAKHHPLPAKLVLSPAGGETSTESVRVS